MHICYEHVRNTPYISFMVNAADKTPYLLQVGPTSLRRSRQSHRDTRMKCTPFLTNCTERLPLHPCLTPTDVFRELRAHVDKHIDTASCDPHLEHLQRFMKGSNDYHGRLLTCIKFDGTSVGLPVMNIYAHPHYRYSDPDDQKGNSRPVSHVRVYILSYNDHY